MRRWRCDDVAATAEDTAVTIAATLLANDSDVDGVESGEHHRL